MQPAARSNFSVAATSMSSSSEINATMSESKRIQGCTKTGAAPDVKLVRFFKSLYPSKTVDNVARDMGVSRGTAKNWVEGKSRPDFFATLHLIAVYGPEFAAEMFPNIRWLQDAFTRHQIEQVIAEREANERRLEALHGRL